MYRINFFLCDNSRKIKSIEINIEEVKSKLGSWAGLWGLEMIHIRMRIRFWLKKVKILLYLKIHLSSNREIRIPWQNGFKLSYKVGVRFINLSWSFYTMWKTQFNAASGITYKMMQNSRYTQIVQLTVYRTAMTITEWIRSCS